MKYSSLNEIKFLSKAYTEGVYSDTPINRKLGRVGMSYAEYTQKLKKEGENSNKDIKGSIKKLREINLKSKLKVVEIKTIISECLGIDSKFIKASFKYGNINGGAFINNAKIPFIYKKSTGDLMVWDPKYRVRFLRETPFGYGGGWETREIEAESEDDAIKKVEEDNKKKWKLSPCSRYSIVSWEDS